MSFPPWSLSYCDNTRGDDFITSIYALPKMMRIGFLSFAHVNVGAGIEYWLKDVCLRVAENHQVTVITTNSGSQRVNIKGVLNRAGISVEEIRVLIPGTSLPTLLGILKLKRLIERQDVVYFLYCPGGLELIAMVMQRILHIPVIAGYTFPLKAYKQTGKLILVRRLYSLILGDAGIKVAKHFAAHQVENNDLANEVAGWGVRSVCKLAAAVDLNLFNPSKKDDTFTVLFLGRLEPTKGVDLLPEIYSALRSRIDLFRFCIVGDGSLSKVAKDLNSPPAVIWYGFVPDGLKRQLLSSSHVLIAPSRAEALMHSGLEAMASGTVVVASDISGVREYVVNGYNGYLARSVEEMVERVVSIYGMWQAGSPYYKLRANAIKTAAMYDFDRVVPRFEELFLVTAKNFRSALVNRKASRVTSSKTS